MPRSITDYPVDPGQLPDIPWLTWIPGRLPEFKVHTDLGKAKAAIGAPLSTIVPVKKSPDFPVRGGVLYQLIDGKWQAVAVVQPGSLKNDNLMFRQPRKWNKAPGITTVIPEHPYEA